MRVAGLRHLPGVHDGAVEQPLLDERLELLAELQGTGRGCELHRLLTLLTPWLEPLAQPLEGDLTTWWD